MIGRTNAIAIGSKVVPESPTTHKVIFIDPFGVVNEQWVEDGEDAIIPTPKVYDLLTFQEWNQETTNITSDRVIGATYNTTDGKTYAFVTLTAVTGLDLVLNLSKDSSATLTIDWGDATQSTFTNTGNFNTGTHTYSAAGEYVITMWISSGTGNLYLGHEDELYPFININNPDHQYYLREIYIGVDIPYLSDYSFYNHKMINSICTNNIQSIRSFSFTNCESLQSIIFPKSINPYHQQNIFISCKSLKYISFSDYCATTDGEFNMCVSLQMIGFGKNITSILTGTFNYCITLNKVDLRHTSLMIIGKNSFSQCDALTEIALPDTLISILDAAFYGCVKITKYILNSTRPPGLENTYVFSGINPICKMYVPDASVTAYKTATNWSTYADYIYPLSEL